MAGAAYERSWALLRATVPSSDWRWQVERDKRGRFQRRIYTHLEFTSQSGQRYQVWFASTAINIKAVGTEGHFMGIPAIIVGGICFIGETEITEELEKRSDAKTARARPMRCTDCGSKILNAAGTTIGDQIEDEVMMLDTPAYRDEKGNWHPPTGPSNDPVRRTP